ncbi:MAG TPA: shikimate kinase [Desulfobaccales bacterium]|nr:shikimate kinase [Desulfobaccales bacterium]
MAHVTQPRPAQPLNLVLIGYRATGKTSVGVRLAEVLQRPFLDLDQVLVREAGRSVADIVAQGGWAEFRRLETELVARYRDVRGLVLATGGGVVLDPDNVAALRENGIIIWLTADPAAIQARLAQDQLLDANRPSLTGGDTIREVAAVAEARAPLYQAAAQISIDTTHRSVAQVVKLVLAALKFEEAKNLGG